MQNLLPENGSLNALFVGLSGNSEGLEDAPFQVNLNGDQLSLTDGSREVVFAYTGSDGMQIEKVYRFSADSYLIGFEVRLTNRADKPIRDGLVVGLRNILAAKKSSYVFEGPAALIDRSLQQVEFDDINAKKGNLSGNIQLDFDRKPLFHDQPHPAQGAGRCRSHHISAESVG